jgi:hypothetical protein
MKKAYSVTVGKNEWKRTLGRTRHRWKDNKVKVKLFLCLTKHHTMKTYWESGGIAPHILDLGTRWR